MRAGPLLIIGVSARAAADSAIRAGFSPLAIDRFQDQDLLRRCLAKPMPDDPGRLVEVAAAFPECPWIYTGGLENLPDVVDALADQRPLYGNTGATLRQVRDPFLVADALRAAGLAALEVQPCDTPLPAGKWLCKPLRSGGGLGIQVAGCEPALAPQTAYRQRHVSGLTCSGVYVAAAGRSVWLGSTLQMSGTGWTGAGGFQYAGSLGPLALSPRYQALFQRIGECLAARFSLSGLFGVDCVLARGQVWPLEVNPRYIASIEVLERAQQTSLLPHHVRACLRGCLPAQPEPRSNRACGKAILYAPEDLRVTEDLLDESRQLASGGLADLPGVDTRVEAGHPLFTLLATGQRVGQVCAKLQSRARLIQERLRRHSSSTRPYSN
jgi:predicted ATP-grasp superfamily ATP-dependent carboligase